MSTKENIKIDSDGFSCQNSAQEDRKCSDYEMRTCCKISDECRGEELSWTVGDPAASLEIKGGNHAAFPTRNLNNDPETFWHSAGAGGGVVLTFNEEVTFTSVKIGARKHTADWNHELRA